MHTLVTALRENPELALFLTLAVGFLIGRLRLGTFRLGNVVGTLFAGAAVGYIAPIRMRYDWGTPAGLMAGAFTESTIIGTAGDAIGRLPVSAEEKIRLLNNIPVSYAVSYLVGTGFAFLFLSHLAPRPLRLDLPA